MEGTVNINIQLRKKIHEKVKNLSNKKDETLQTTINELLQEILFKKEK